MARSEVSRCSELESWVLSFAVRTFSAERISWSVEVSKVPGIWFLSLVSSFVERALRGAEAMFGSEVWESSFVFSVSRISWSFVAVFGSEARLSSFAFSVSRICWTVEATSGSET